MNNFIKSEIPLNFWKLLVIFCYCSLSSETLAVSLGNSER